MPAPIPTGDELVREFATRGHRLVNDDWSAWWLACQYAMENGIPPGVVDAGAERVEQFRRPTAAQLKAAESLWQQAVAELGEICRKENAAKNEQRRIAPTITEPPKLSFGDEERGRCRD